MQDARLKMPAGIIINKLSDDVRPLCQTAGKMLRKHMFEKKICLSPLFLSLCWAMKDKQKRHNESNSTSTCPIFVSTTLASRSDIGVIFRRRRCRSRCRRWSRCLQQCLPTAFSSILMKFYTSLYQDIVSTTPVSL